jgi:hypothetical protein
VTEHQGPASIEISIDKDTRVVWMSIQVAEESMEFGIPVDHAYMISQALYGACQELGYNPQQSAN